MKIFNKELSDLLDQYDEWAYEDFDFSDLGKEFKDLVELRESIHKVLNTYDAIPENMKFLKAIDSQLQSSGISKKGSYSSVDREAYPRSHWWYWLDDLIKFPTKIRKLFD